MMTNLERAPKSLIPTARQKTVRSAFGFRNRGLLGALLLGPVAVGVLFSEPTMVEDSFSALALNAASWMFFLLYVAMRIWSTLFIGGHKDKVLTMEGPYSVCRNPLYCGSFFFALSLACILKSFTFGIATLAAAFIYLQWVVRSEEHFLKLHFGEDFSKYCQRTPRFWPRWSAHFSPTHVKVDVTRLKKECIRLGRAALIPLTLQALMQLRIAPWWPHWTTIP